MKYAIVTFGCRVNQADSADIERHLRAAGASRVAPEDADLVVVNTCSVTATADQGARQMIRRIARANPEVRVVATGCYATRAAEELQALPGVRAVVSNPDKDGLAALAMAGLGTDPTTAERFGGGDGPCGEPGTETATGRTTATLRVQTGCDERCAYCIIPSTRGAGRSMPLREVLSEVDRLAREGYKEAALTGVHIGSYGRDLSPATSLVRLLAALDGHPSSLTFRLSSLEPMDCTDDIIDLVARSGRFAPHFHLPLQHASDRMLRLMRRPYSRDVYHRLVTRVRECLPHAGIGSDLVVGFPGEDETDLAANLTYLAGSPLTYLHVFPYSDRPGTEASTMASKVPKPVIRDRARAVRECGAGLSRRFRAAHQGSVRPGLTIDGGHVVLTDNYLKVRIPTGEPENQRVAVRITNAAEPLLGELVAGSTPSQTSGQPLAV